MTDSGLSEAARRVAAGPAAEAADAVDREARFPAEAVAGMRTEGLLAALVPSELGGGGASLSEVAAATKELGRACSNAAMVFAMHQIQAHCVVRHGATDHLQTWLQRLARDQPLLASATTERTQGGDVRSSTCAVEPAGDGRVRLQKEASVISYGDSADAILATARAAPDRPASDQVLVACDHADYQLEQRSGWDTLGFRGTCSLGYLLTADVPDGAVLPVPFATISAETMLPTSHLLWASVWLGIATEAVARARRYLRDSARSSPGTMPPAGLRTAEVVALLHQFDALVAQAGRRYDDALAGGSDLGSMGFAIAMNDLKVSASTLVVDITTRCLSICGIAGYREDGPLSIARLLRDAHAAPLMISNERILGHNAQLLLVHKQDG